MDKKLYTIRERILYFSENQNFTKRAFCKKIGVNHTYLSGNNLKSSVDVEILSNIIYNFPYLNINWIITGNGEIMRNNDNSQENELLRENRELRKEIDFLRKKIENMEKSKKLKNNYDSVCQM